MATTFHKVKDNWYALIDGAINNSVTSIVIDGAGAGGEPTVPFYCDIDSEAIRVSAVATNTPTAGKSTLTVTRAQLGTSAASHSDNAAIQQNAYAQQLTEIHTAVNGIEAGTTTLTEVNVTGDVVAGGDLIGDNVSVGGDAASVARHIVNTGPAGVAAVEFQKAGVQRGRYEFDAATATVNWKSYNSSGVLQKTTPVWSSGGTNKSFMRQFNADGINLAPRTGSAPCGAAVHTEFQSARNYQWVMPFDQNTDENAVCTFALPPDYDGGTFEVDVLWTATSGTAAQVVRWSCWMAAFANDSTLAEATAGGIISAEDAYIAASDLHIARIVAVTPYTAGTLANMKWVNVNLFRDANHANDTLAADALLIGIVITLS
jgi:hypothetical protein